ncbi:TrbI/VirB10 family protein [Serratia ureilytica]|uniref:TrbI/VirB10 family protein n=1 Tax=Serratia ureilytica TaxID=300181 RepID=UPI0034C5E182
MNINRWVKGKQHKLLTLIIAGIVLLVGTFWYLNKAASRDVDPNAEVDALPAEPNLTGQVSNTFDEAQGGVLVDAQLREQAANKAVEDMKGILVDIKARLDEVNGENAALKAQLDSMQGQMSSLRAQEGQGAQPASGAAAQPPHYQLQPAPVKHGQLDSFTFDYSKVDAAKKPRPDSFYVPSGTFSNAIILEGADVNASVSGEEHLKPMQFKLTGMAHLPNNKRLGKLDNCFVTAGAFGDVSSERAEVRVKSLSCVVGDKHIDMEVKGHAVFYGKAGIKGVPVMRNGKILGLAFGAGALSGIGQSVSQVGQTVAGVGATSTISGGDVARAGLGGGASTAATKLADYYIQRAEQYHPIIPIGAANRVEIVFTEGFRASFIEDQEASEQAAQAGSAPHTADTTTAAQGNSDLPPELIGKLGDAESLQINDFITPTGPQGGKPSQGGS